MKIQVLGSGCPTCKKLFEITKIAVKDIGIINEVEYITDVQRIVDMGLVSSPVLAIDGKPLFVGLVPKLEEIKKAILKISEK